MSSHPERDRAVERLLSSRRASPSEPFVLTPQCPEADVLAAWTDGGLEPARAAIVESHIAGCPRCEAIVAAVAASAPPEAASFWTRWRFAVPAFAAVAAAASIAVVVWSRREPVSLPAPTDVTARVEPTPTPSMTSAPPSVPEAPAISVPAARARANKPAPIAEPAPSAQPTPAKPTAAAEPKEAQARGHVTYDKMNFDSTRAASARPQPAAPPPPPELQPRNAASQAMSAGASAAQGVVVPPPPTTPPPPPAAPVAPTITVVAESPLADTKKTLTGGSYVPAGGVAAFESEDTPPPVAAQGFAGRGGRGGGGGGGVAPPVKWLILASGQVERSFDSGRTWSTVALAPGQQAVAGVAPSRDVCWIVGRGGLVLLMTDGQTFQATTRPTSVDLNFVRIEGPRVIVSTVAGDTFVTTDAGRTWTKEGHLQGF